MAQDNIIKIKIFRHTPNDICDYSDHVGESIDVIAGEHDRCYLTVSHPQFFILKSDCEIILEQPPTINNRAKAILLKHVGYKFGIQADNNFLIELSKILPSMEEYASMKVAEETKVKDREIKRLENRNKYLDEQLGEVCRESNSQIKELADLKSNQGKVEGVITAKEIETQIFKHLDSLPYAGGYPSNYRETLSIHLEKWMRDLMMPKIVDAERIGAIKFGRWILKHLISTTTDNNGSSTWKFDNTDEFIDTAELVDLSINDPFLLNKYPKNASMKTFELLLKNKTSVQKQGVTVEDAILQNNLQGKVSMWKEIYPDTNIQSQLYNQLLPQSCL